MKLYVNPEGNDLSEMLGLDPIRCKVMMQCLQESQQALNSPLTIKALEETFDPNEREWIFLMFWHGVYLGTDN